jgi:hypothetical protein
MQEQAETQQTANTSIGLWILRHLVLLAVCVIGLILLILSGDFVYMQGYFRDENNLKIPSFIHTVSWLAFLASFLIPIISLVLWNVSVRARRTVKYLLILLVVVFFAWLFCRDSFSAFVKEYASDWVYPLDGVSAELSDGEIFAHSGTHTDGGNSFFRLAEADYCDCEWYCDPDNPTLFSLTPVSNVKEYLDPALYEQIPSNTWYAVLGITPIYPPSIWEGEKPVREYIEILKEYDQQHTPPEAIDALTIDKYNAGLFYDFESGMFYSYRLAREGEGDSRTKTEWSISEPGTPGPLTMEKLEY